VDREGAPNRPVGRGDAFARHRRGCGVAGARPRPRRREPRPRARRAGPRPAWVPGRDPADRRSKRLDLARTRRPRSLRRARGHSERVLRSARHRAFGLDDGASRVPPAGPRRLRRRLGGIVAGPERGRVPRRRCRRRGSAGGLKPCEPARQPVHDAEAGAAHGTPRRSKMATATAFRDHTELSPTPGPMHEGQPSRQPHPTTKR